MSSNFSPEVEVATMFSPPLDDQKKMYAQALREYQVALELDPENATIYYNCGLTLGKMGLFNQAGECFKEALRIKPNFIEAFEKLETIESLTKSSTKK